MSFKNHLPSAFGAAPRPHRQDLAAERPDADENTPKRHRAGGDGGSSPSTHTPLTPVERWRVAEASGAKFDALAAPDTVLRGDALERLANTLGWPALGSPAFLVVAYGVYSLSSHGDRSVVELQRDAWIALHQDQGTADTSVAADRLWDSLRADYRAPTRGCMRFLDFHKFVFFFLLVEQTRATAPQPAQAAPSMHSCVSPHAQMFGTFCRAIPAANAKRGLIAALGQLSPFAFTFCAYLDAHSVRRINFDQWVNFVVFSRMHRLEMLLGTHSNDDSWSSLIDGYVDWLRGSYAHPRGLQQLGHVAASSRRERLAPDAPGEAGGRQRYHRAETDHSPLCRELARRAEVDSDDAD